MMETSPRDANTKPMMIDTLFTMMTPHDDGSCIEGNVGEDVFICLLSMTGCLLAQPMKFFILS